MCLCSKMASNYKFFEIIDKSGLRKVIINNIKKKNALNMDAYRELTDILAKSRTDDNVKLVAITGAGDFFSSGNDLSAMMTCEDPAEAIEISKDILANLTRAFFTFPKLLICVVNGPCIGIAATTAILCDVIYASETAYFYTPFSLLGICAEACSSYTFPKIMGKSKASEMLLLNYKLCADEALRYHVVSDVIPKADFDTKLWPKIEKFAALPRESIMVTKRLMKKFELSELETALNVEIEELAKRFTTDECMEALINFATRKSKL